MKHINYYLLIVSLICLIAYFFTTREILKNRNVRLEGALISAQIIDFRHAKTHRKATVQVKGKVLDAGAINDSYKKGDILTVYYLRDVNTVVQEHVNPSRYYWYLGFSSILLILGIAMLIESLKGKNIWIYISKG